MTTKRRISGRYGNNLYWEILPPDAHQPLKIIYWDLWIALVLVNQFDRDWDRLMNYVRGEMDGYSLRNDAAEGLLNHLRMLRQTLDRARLTVEDILLGANPEFLKKQSRKAVRKILEMRFQPKEKSPWMIHTPRKQHSDRAMRGYWEHFPVSPNEYASALESQYKASGWYNEDQSFALERKLSAFVREQEAGASLPQLFALYRAFLAVVVEKIGRVDDSYGVIGDLYEEIFEKYVQLDWATLDMPSAVFFQDLLELIIWENYGFTYKKHPTFFASLAPAQVPLVESTLREQWEELADLELDYHAEKALTLIGMLYTQQQLFHRFVPIAEEMGTRAWERITTMSEMAEKHGRYDLASAVYEACLGPGSHEKFLRQKYQELKSRLRSA